MADKDKVEVLLKLAEVSWRDYSERRAIEWKINFALWLALGIFSGFMFQHQTALPIWVAITITVLLACTFLVYTFLWKAEVKERNLFDKNAAQHYWTAAREELSIKSHEVRTPKESKLWPKTHLSQVVITLLFVLMAVFAVWAPRWAV